MLKINVKIPPSAAIAGLCYFAFSLLANATTFTYDVPWSAGGNSGSLGSCTFNLPELAPLSQPRTLVVDQHLPDGTELYHWGYDSFIPSINASCTPTGTSTHNSLGVGGYLRIWPEYAVIGYRTGIYTTNIAGIGMKIYVKFNSRGTGVNRVNTSALSIANSYNALDTEYQLLLLTGSGNSAYFGTTFSPDNDTAIPKNYYLSSTANHSDASLRAVLVKTGNITYTSTPLRLQADVTFGNNSGYTPVPNLIGSGGIVIIPPACQLRGATDYTIEMGKWELNTPGRSFPASGSATPVNINLECSGSLDNVYFRFEDAGSSPLSNNNVSLYDGSGTKIDGLEIEMRYGDVRIDVDNSTTTNVGAQGAVKTNPADISFSSQSTVPFTAHYVQRSTIQRNGVDYTGAITGRVNMYVTYQ